MPRVRVLWKMLFLAAGWISLGEDRASNGAFLFTWPDGDVTQKPIKLPKVWDPAPVSKLANALL